MTQELTTTTDQAAQIAALVKMTIDSLQSANTKRDYGRALADFMTWHTTTQQTGLSKAIVNAYKVHLQTTGTGAINQRLSAIRKFAREAVDNGLIDDRTAQGIARVEGIAQRGTKAGNWLTADEAAALIDAPDDTTLKGKRDRALLAVLIGCGLRRDELARLTVEHIQQREARWVIVDLIGKRAKSRTIPMAGWVKALIDKWTQAAGIGAGSVFVTVTPGKAGKLGSYEGNTGAGAGKSKARAQRDNTTAQSIMRAVQKYGAEIGKPELRPHDLRRTFAKLARAGQASLEQIQINLGHDSLTTTQRYLGANLDYQNSPSDAIKLSVRMNRITVTRKI